MPNKTLEFIEISQKIPFHHFPVSKTLKIKKLRWWMTSWHSATKISNCAQFNFHIFKCAPSQMIFLIVMFVTFVLFATTISIQNHFFACLEGKNHIHQVSFPHWFEASLNRTEREKLNFQRCETLCHRKTARQNSPTELCFVGIEIIFILVY